MNIKKKEQKVVYNITMSEEELNGFLRLIGPDNDDTRVAKGMTRKVAETFDNFYLDNADKVRHLDRRQHS